MGMGTGTPITRRDCCAIKLCERAYQREFNPQAFQVFGPKIVATRGSYDDKGLESRFLTEEMGSRKLCSDIPINLPDSFKEEARELRNK